MWPILFLTGLAFPPKGFKDLRNYILSSTYWQE
jgi:hypothetical protein